MLLLLLTVLGNTREDSSKYHLFLVLCREFISQGLEHWLSKSLSISVIVLPDSMEDLSYLEVFHVHLSLLEQFSSAYPQFVYLCKFLGILHMGDHWDDA